MLHAIIMTCCCCCFCCAANYSLALFMFANFALPFARCFAGQLTLSQFNAVHCSISARRFVVAGQLAIFYCAALLLLLFDELLLPTRLLLFDNLFLFSLVCCCLFTTFAADRQLLCCLGMFYLIINACFSACRDKATHVLWVSQ